MSKVKGEESRYLMNPCFSSMTAVVCYEHNRDALRNRLIVWLKFQGEFVDESDGDHDIFKKYFDAMDEDKNAKLSRKEFSQLIKSNESVGQVSIRSKNHCDTPLF